MLEILAIVAIVEISIKIIGIIITFRNNGMITAPMVLSVANKNRSYDDNNRKFS